MNRFAKMKKERIYTLFETLSSSVSRIIVELKTDTDILDVRVGGDGIIEGVLNKNTSILE